MYHSEWSLGMECLLHASLQHSTQTLHDMTLLCKVHGAIFQVIIFISISFSFTPERSKCDLYHLKKNPVILFMRN